MKRGVLLAGLGISVAGTLLGAWELGEVVPEAPTRPYGPQAGQAVADLLGINEAVAAPARWVRDPGVSRARIQHHLAADAEATRALGARWVRVNSAAYPFLNHLEATRDPHTLERMDRLVALVQRAGLDAVVVIGPWPGNRTGLYTERYVPEDLDAYTAWVRAVVERYDGDGTADAPGLLRPVGYWEVDNEPDLHHHVAPRGAPRGYDPATFETPEEYAAILVATAAAVRAASPEARILNGGIFSTSEPTGRGYLEEVLRQPGAAEAVDVLSVHAYFEERTPARFDEALDNALALAGGRPVFVTETGVPSDPSRHRWVDEAWQARMVGFVVGECLARGVGRLFWHTLADPPPGEGTEGGYATHSLLRRTGAGDQTEAKPAGQVYRRIAEVAGGVPLADVVRVPASGGRVLRLGELGWFVYEGEGVRVPDMRGAVLDLVDGTRRPWPEEGGVDAPALVVP